MRFTGLGGWEWIIILCIICIGPLILAGMTTIFLTRRSKHDQGVLRKCPYCAEMVKVEAKVCKHCGREIPPAFKIPDEYSIQNLPVTDVDAIRSRTPDEKLRIAKNHIKKSDWRLGVATLQFITENASPDSVEYTEAYNILYQLLKE